MVEYALRLLISRFVIPQAPFWENMHAGKCSPALSDKVFASVLGTGCSFCGVVISAKVCN